MAIINGRPVGDPSRTSNFDRAIMEDYSRSAAVPLKSAVGEMTGWPR